MFRALLLLPAAAALRFSYSFGDHMVIQRGKPVNVWGYGTAGQSINVTLGDTIVSGAIDATGLFKLSLPAQAASPLGAGATITAQSGDGQTASITDVLFGDVYFCSGQSNMQFSVQMSNNSAVEIQNANAFPYIRLYQTAYGEQGIPAQDFGSPQMGWSPSSNISVGTAGFGGFSAVCYYFGRDLFMALGNTTAIGLMESAVGGTAIRQWTPREALASCPQPYNSPIPYGTQPYLHSALYNAMVAPLGTGPTALSGMVYLQAESDSWPQTPFGYYTCQTTRQVQSWRALVQDALLPWLLVQVSTTTSYWYPELRQEQLAATVLPAVGFVPSFDYGDINSPYGPVHPRFKQPVGARLASLALRLVYNQLPPAGSMYASYPPPSYLDAAVSTDRSTGILTVNVTLAAPAAVLNVSGLSCPAGAEAYCGPVFAIQTNDTAWWNASLAMLNNGSPTNGSTLLTLTTTLPQPYAGSVYAVGSAYAWSTWPQAQLVTVDGWPVMPWNQSLILNAPF